MWQKVKNIYHLGVAIAANMYYGFPGRKLTVIAVTGTDGKTTTVNLIYDILKTAGKDVSMISTVGAIIHGEPSSVGSHVTNPAALPLQRFLHVAVTKRKLEKKNNFLVLEVSSHGIDQYRIWGIPITLGLITNITEEHLDYHKTYENYAKTKIKLLKMAKIRVINRDDESYSLIKQQLRHIAENTIYTFSLKNKAHFTQSTISGKIPWEKYNTFTRYNILAAISACSLVTDVTKGDISKALKLFVHPLGRQHIVSNKVFSIMIDFAHTPNGLLQNLISLKESKKYIRIISLIGAEGYRDPNKRSKLGQIAAQFSDIVIVTAVDPRGLIDEINKQILEGITQEKGGASDNVYIEPDRQKAIELAVSLAKKGDIIGIFGKGHEKSMNLDGKHEIPWSDYEAVEKALKKKESRSKN